MSAPLQRLFCIVLLFATLGACTNATIRAPVEGRTASSPVHAGMHRVRGGDSLYSIAWIYDHDYQDIARWNGIGAPYLIFPGQQIRVTAPSPGQQYRPDKSTSRQKLASSHKHTGKKAAPVSGGTSDKSVPARKPSANYRSKKKNASGIKNEKWKPLKWQWPVKGPILRKFSQKGNKGLDIGGNNGQPVLAAASGRIVYSGSGLIGYGKLIIVKHNKSHLSAYAYNSELLVKEGDNVVGGQRIARMGRAAGKDTMLHFEIRLKGKPVNPLGYLPKT